MRPVKFSLAAALLFAALAGGAQAADTESMFDVAFGAAATTDYISRGITQTEHDPAIQGYFEIDSGILYAGAWASNVKFGDTDAEVDLSAGIRPEAGPFSFDFGYVHYVYPGDIAPDYGELYAQVDYAPNDTLTFGGKVYFAPDYSQLGGSAVYSEGSVEIALPADFAFSAALGYQAFDSSVGLPDYLTWNAGLSWTWKDTFKVDLRYSDTDISKGACTNFAEANGCDPRVILSVSVDTSWSALKGGS
jgi:uncharacterized protein (TIGR02001 family)